MVDYNEIRKILNSSGMSIRHYKKATRVVDNSCFRGASLSAVEDVKTIFASDERESIIQSNLRQGIQTKSLADVVDSANQLTTTFVNMLSSNKGLTAQQIHDSVLPSGNGTIYNAPWAVGTGEDFSKHTASAPNVYLSPWEACSLYSQKGIFEAVINKKSLSVLLNGCTIENPKLSNEQIDKINERMEVHNFRAILAKSIRDSLVYGGSLLVPMLKKDRPATFSLPVSSLLKLGVLKKDCIDYFINLDRWNTVILPEYDPTQKTFYDPEYFTLLYLGADVHKSRVARIVAGEQAGYFGNIYTQGWGISDFCGYLQSGMNYKVAVQSLPMMIQQMSILARVINVDGVLATEGTNILDSLAKEDTIRVRQISANNPINLDVLGEIKSIDRNFQHVPELLRLLRQDFCGNAVIPEPMLFTCEKAGLGGADDTEANQNKQWEAVRMQHHLVESQVKRLARILVIDALGTDNDVIQSLPYTRLRFDEPQIATSVERAQIGKNFSETVFNLVSARLPMDIAVRIAQKHLSSDMAVSSDVLDEIKEVQTKIDKQADEQFEMEMQSQQNEIAVKQASTEGGAEGQTNADGDKKTLKLKGEAAGKNSSKEKYTRLEQKQHEKVTSGNKRSEALAKAKNKQA